jgi:alpha-tubulin suppressor-like RCC1 family protein
LLTKEGEIYSFGSNKFGQLGDSTFYNRYYPTKIYFKESFIDIKASYDFSLALTNNKKVVGFGSNINFQLGLKNDLTISSNLIDFNTNENEIKKIIQISTGSSNCLALSENNEIFSWGSNYNGESYIGFIF